MKRSRRDRTTHAKGVEIILAPADDQRLRRAAARARARLPEFLDAVRENAPGVECLVKAGFPRIDKAGHKHMWVSVTAINDGVVTGVLVDDPQEKVDVMEGQHVHIALGDIEDWMIHRGGQKRTGGFSIPVLSEIEREQEKKRRD